MMSTMRWALLPATFVAALASVVPAYAGTRAAGSAPTDQITVMTRNGPTGTYLTDNQGRSLYLFVADTGTTSTCSGPCAAAWPPLITTGAPKAGPGVDAAMLGTTSRSGGDTQVTYAGHPLYLYAADKAPGDTTGQGVNNFGALWWLVAPKGSAITGSGTPSSSPTGGGGGSGPPPRPGY